MPVSVKTVVYNEVNLRKWREQIPEVEQYIRQNEQVIGARTNVLQPLRVQLTLVDSQIASTQFNLMRARSAGAHDMIHHHDHYHHIHGHHHNGFIHNLGDMALGINISNLESSLRRLQMDRAMLVGQIQPHEQAIREAQTHITSYQSQREWLNNHIPAAELFLRHLNEQPEQLLNNLRNKVVAAFNEYEEQHFTGLSPQVRLSFVLLQQGLDELVNFPLPQVTPERQKQINYLRLCGFLQDLYQRVAQEGIDKTFLEHLRILLESTHIEMQGDLPDGARTNYTAHAWYQDAQHIKPGYFGINEQDLLAIEQRNFQQALERLIEPDLILSSTLDNRVVSAAKLIDAEVRGKIQKNEEVDYFFYTRALHHLNTVFNNTSNAYSAKCLGEMAEHASGNSSIGKKVLGGLLAVIGTLVIAASLAGLAATWGSSSFLSAFGLALGLNLLESQMALGLGFSLSAVAGTGLTFWGSDTLEAGRRKGLSQDLKDIESEVGAYLSEEPPAYTEQNFTL